MRILLLVAASHAIIRVAGIPATPDNGKAIGPCHGMGIAFCQDGIHTDKGGTPSLVSHLWAGQDTDAYADDDDDDDDDDGNNSDRKAKKTSPELNKKHMIEFPRGPEHVPGAIKTDNLKRKVQIWLHDQDDGQAVRNVLAKEGSYETGHVPPDSLKPTREVELSEEGRRRRRQRRQTPDPATPRPITLSRTQRILFCFSLSGIFVLTTFTKAGAPWKTIKAVRVYGRNNARVQEIVKKMNKHKGQIVRANGAVSHRRLKPKSHKKQDDIEFPTWVDWGNTILGGIAGLTGASLYCSPLIEELRR